MTKNINFSLLIYASFVLVIIFFKYTEVLMDYALFLTLGIVLIIIKDILAYFYEHSPTRHHYYDTNKIFSTETNSLYQILFVNRHYIFPILLIVYIIILLIEQTHIFGLEKTNIFRMINNNYILGVTILSGILTVFKEEKDLLYKMESQNAKEITGNIILTVVLSLLGTYIIYQQVFNLGILVYPISIITGILIFVIGVSILEDDETIK